MPRGTLHVNLISAKGLNNNDFLTNVDPYVILTYRSQEHKSSVAQGAGSNPKWNETFLFTVSDDVCEIDMKLMDEDGFTQDDFLGRAIIPFHSVFYEGIIPTAVYSVVNDNKEYCGEIHVAFTFTPEE
ncbi:elicitor-responsive protein 3-like [Vicia villosa]|uniref:elicitor-responsive protein 3-like n=1 Tax=Vicia villosa TaxID=3911 RepID=UPI00273AA26E|nr:elicitor-responsive protein 3-like [Vicia villosa]